MRKHLEWRRRHSLPRSLTLEPLEDRVLLSGTSLPWNSQQLLSPATTATTSALVQQADQGGANLQGAPAAWTAATPQSGPVTASLSSRTFQGAPTSFPSKQTSFSLQTNLVSDGPASALYSDAHLLNPWGIAVGPGGGFWISDNGTGLATLYDGAGKKLSLEVRIPTPAGAAGVGMPTGQVYNGSQDFALAPGKPAMFLFATEDGTISGWNPAVNLNNAILKVDDSASGAIYKGLALGTSSAGNVLYAANFHAGTIDTFDANFAPLWLPGSFTDPNIPAGFAPFNVQNLGGRIYVTYAKQDAAKYDSQIGPGYGFVDVFDTDGNLIRRIASGDPGNAGSPLNSPWGLALAPANFGAFSNDLLVGNFGDGHINVYDPTASDHFLGQFSRDNSGDPVVIDGLWGLTFGNDHGAGQSNILYFTAGTNSGTDGLFGQEAYQVPVSSQGGGQSATPNSPQPAYAAATSSQQNVAPLSSTPAQPYSVAGSNQNTAADGPVQTDEQPYSVSTSNQDAGEYSQPSYQTPAYAAATSSQDPASSSVTGAQQPAAQTLSAAVQAMAFLKTSAQPVLTGLTAAAAPTTAQPAVPPGAVEQSVAATSQRIVENHAAPMAVEGESPSGNAGEIMRQRLTAFGIHGTGRVVDAQTQTPPESPAGTSLNPEPEVYDLLSGVLPFDLASAERGVQKFFERLESLNEEWDRSQLGTRLAPWVVVVAAATVAFETARRQMRKQPPHLYEWASSWRGKAGTWVPDLGDPPLLNEP